MTKWYRAAQSEKIEYVFSGDGGLYVAGRWNHKGRKVIYCSQSISLCTLEWLSHNGLSVSGYSYYRFSIEIPDELILEIKISELPKEWNCCPSTDKTRKIAEDILFSKNNYLAMAIPSVMIPEEKNLIINPIHNRYAEILKSTKSLGLFTAPDRSSV
ncbi:MAG: RES domain-containing protein [Tatlockia sp.]|nr:RES domain-containing protein [Tatlockia sp.]